MAGDGAGGHAGIFIARANFILKTMAHHDDAYSSNVESDPAKVSTFLVLNGHCVAECWRVFSKKWHDQILL